MKSNFTIVPAKPEQASEIATLVMLAMNHDCCQNFCGNQHTLDEFHRMMTGLVNMDESQHSYRNTLVAMDNEGKIAGACVVYDGKDLKRLRKAFFQAARTHLDQDFEGMLDETGPEEYYIDSLAVKPEFQKRGIATLLLQAVIKRHGGQKPVGLLVDKGNPKAERLYNRVGFVHVDDSEWGGHAMRHLQYPMKCAWAKHDELSEKYHDEEWGVPVHDERKHFMYLIMETMSCGLSWQMMLQRREVFGQCFANFDASKVAEFTTDDMDRIMQTEGMIRSRSKIEAMIDNAKAFMKVAKRFGSFDQYVWSFTQGRSLIYPSHQREVPKSNDLSDKVAKDMKKKGFKFVGSVIIYSFLQAIGIINDHESTCWRYDILSRNCTIVDDRSPVM